MMVDMNLYQELIDNQKYAGYLLSVGGELIEEDTATWYKRVLDPPVKIKMRYKKIKEGSLVETEIVERVHLVLEVFTNCLFDVSGWSKPWWAVMKWEIVE